MALRTTKHEHIPTVEILSQKELEREFCNMIKVFDHKETEMNWEARENALICARGILRSNCIVNWRSTVLQGIHDIVQGIVKSMDSLRTALALEALDLVSDIGTFIGYYIDFYTLNTLLIHLLRRGATTKNIIAAHTKETTITLLSNTSYHSKIVHLLASTLGEKNNQTRHYATIYMNAFLDTHGRREYARSALERSCELDLVETFLKKGLLDATPFVRESCRQTFWTFQAYWPSRAERMYQTFDKAIFKQLERARPDPDGTPSVVDRTDSGSVSSFVLSRTMPRPTKTLLPQSTMHSRLSTSSSASSLYEARSLPPSPSTSQSSESRCSLLIRKHSGKTPASSLRDATKPSRNYTTPVPGKNATQPLRRPRTEAAQKEAAQASVTSLMRMFTSKDSATNCAAIYKLSNKLRQCKRDSSSSAPLPLDVPSRVDLLPLFMKYLSATDLDIQLYRDLMSWDSLAGIFVHVLSLNHYVPTLVIASREHASSKHARASSRDRIAEIYAKGLQRLKIYLKRKESDLAKNLQDMLTAAVHGSALADSSARRDLLAHPEHREELACGLIQWMDELVCDYIGLGEEEDEALLLEGSIWLSDLPSPRAHQWFDKDQNLESCLVDILKTLQSTPSKTATHDALIILIGRLRLANERVFEAVAGGSDQLPIPTCALWNPGYENDDVESLQVDVMSPPDLLDEGDLSFTREQTWDPTDELESVGNSSTGMTADISKIKLEFALAAGNTNVKTTSNDFDTSSTSHATKRFWPPSSIDDSRGNGHNLPFANSGDDHITMDDFKRRKRNAQFHDTTIPNTVEERIKLLRDGIRRLNEAGSRDDRIFGKLAALSQDTPVLRPWSKGGIDTTGITIWKDAKDDHNLIVLLVEALIAFILGEAKEETRVQALVLIKCLLQNQSGLFEQLATKPPCFTFDLAKALVSCKVDFFSTISTAAEDAFSTLLCTFSHQTGLDILMYLLQQELSQQEHGPTMSLETQLHPLSTLFSHLSDLVPKIPNQLLEEFLKHGADELLVKGFNHPGVSVRKSCVQVLVAAHGVLGDECLSTYFSSLRGDQMDLLRHYISRAEKANCK